MNNNYFNLGGIGNVGPYINSNGVTYTIDEQNSILSRTLAAWYLTLVYGQVCHVFLVRTRCLVIYY
jgi:hypothetical protein